MFAEPARVWSWPHCRRPGTLPPTSRHNPRHTSSCTSTCADVIAMDYQSYLNVGDVEGNRPQVRAGGGGAHQRHARDARPACLRRPACLPSANQPIQLISTPTPARPQDVVQPELGNLMLYSLCICVFGERATAVAPGCLAALLSAAQASLANLVRSPSWEAHRPFACAHR